MSIEGNSLDGYKWSIIYCLDVTLGSFNVQVKTVSHTLYVPRVVYDKKERMGSRGKNWKGWVVEVNVCNYSW